VAKVPGVETSLLYGDDERTQSRIELLDVHRKVELHDPVEGQLRDVPITLVHLGCRLEVAVEVVPRDLHVYEPTILEL
jgi:hypothetical protein